MRTLHIPEVHFRMKLRSWYATMWYTPTWRYATMWYTRRYESDVHHTSAYRRTKVVGIRCVSWWLIFVKAKMWFGSGRDSASLSSSCRSLNLLCVWFLPSFLRSWFGVLTFDSNSIFAWSFCFLSPTSSKDRWLKTKQNKAEMYSRNCTKILVPTGDSFWFVIKYCFLLKKSFCFFRKYCYQLKIAFGLCWNIAI